MASSSLKIGMAITDYVFHSVNKLNYSVKFMMKSLKELTVDIIELITNWLLLIIGPR